MDIVSDTPALTQSDVQLVINWLNAASFTVGGTDGKVVTEYRTVSVIAGENTLSFLSDSDKVKVLKVEMY